MPRAGGLAFPRAEGRAGEIAGAVAVLAPPGETSISFLKAPRYDVVRLPTGFVYLFGFLLEMQMDSVVFGCNGVGEGVREWGVGGWGAGHLLGSPSRPDVGFVTVLLALSTWTTVARCFRISEVGEDAVEGPAS